MEMKEEMGWNEIVAEIEKRLNTSRADVRDGIDCFFLVTVPEGKAELYFRWNVKLVTKEPKVEIRPIKWHKSGGSKELVEKIRESLSDLNLTFVND